MCGCVCLCIFVITYLFVIWVLDVIAGTYYLCIDACVLSWNVYEFVFERGDIVLMSVCMFMHWLLWKVLIVLSFVFIHLCVCFCVHNESLSVFLISIVC